MEGLYYNLKKEDNITLHLLRFYNDSNYVIVKKVVGAKPDYLKKEIANFKMQGISVMGEPEYTFFGAFSETLNRVSFKVENEIIGSSESWVHKDVLSFNGSINQDGSLQIRQTSKRSNYSFELIYLKTNDEELFKLLLSQI